LRDRAGIGVDEEVAPFVHGDGVPTARMAPAAASEA
jgi:hypothetical protein